MNPQGTGETASRVGLYQPASDEYVMFVHGWNTEPWLKKRWAETVFKRLWWQGYQGRVGLFDWPSRQLPSLDILVNYDRSEFLAWHSGNALRQLLNDINTSSPGQVRILAHSQGNVVAGEALRQMEPGVVHTYVASQGALSASMYEPEILNISPQIEPFDIQTPEVYGHYPADPETRPFLQTLADKVGILVSYFNIQDYALTGDTSLSPRWEVNNRMKPDNSLNYFYEGDVEFYPPSPPALGFFQLQSSSVGFDQKRLLSFPENSYEIFAFGAESRTRALGTVFAPQGFLPVARATDFAGSRDLADDLFDDKRYSHSRQFRSSLVDEQYYWRSFVTDTHLDDSLVRNGE